MALPRRDAEVCSATRCRSRRAPWKGRCQSRTDQAAIRLSRLDRHRPSCSLVVAGAVATKVSQRADRCHPRSRGHRALRCRRSHVPQGRHARSRQPAHDHDCSFRAIPLQPQPDLCGIHALSGRPRRMGQQRGRPPRTRTGGGPHGVAGHPARRALPRGSVSVGVLAVQAGGPSLAIGGHCRARKRAAGVVGCTAPGALPNLNDPSASRYGCQDQRSHSGRAHRHWFTPVKGSIPLLRARR
jgi:hypothetical protein